MNRNYSNISYAESPFGTLSEFMSKSFGWMFAGLLVTFGVGMGAVASGLIFPIINSGLFIFTSIAELVMVFVLSALPIPHRHHSAPHTAPTSGKAQSAYRIFFAFQSNCGIGRAENMANATAMVCKAVIIFRFLYNRPVSRTRPAPRRRRGQPPRC